MQPYLGYEEAIVQSFEQETDIENIMEPLRLADKRVEVCLKMYFWGTGRDVRTY
jgi:hypothetical protein